MADGSVTSAKIKEAMRMVSPLHIERCRTRLDDPLSWPPRTVSSCDFGRFAPLRVLPVYSLFDHAASGSESSRKRETRLTQKATECQQGQPDDGVVICRIDATEQGNAPAFELISPGTIER
jgi:hypothetical protein